MSKFTTTDIRKNRKISTSFTFNGIFFIALEDALQPLIIQELGIESFYLKI